MRLPIATVLLACAAACAPDLDPDDYETAGCDEDSDCVVVVMTDVCSDCAEVAIIQGDQATHRRDLEAAQTMCFGVISDCALSHLPACQAGTCVAVPTFGGGGGDNDDDGE